jgi:hypothetical protein
VVRWLPGWVWKGFLSRPGRIGVAGVVLIGVALVLGVSSAVPGRVAVAIGEAGFLAAAAVAPVVWSVRALNRLLRPAGRAGIAAVDLVFFVFVFVFPSALAALVAPGGGWRPVGAAFFGRSAGGPLVGLLGPVQFVCQLACPVLVVGFPEVLRRLLPWEDASAAARSLIPGCLTAGACAATWLVAVVMNVPGGPLAGFPAGLVMAAGLFAAALLAPAYKLLARACWQSGAAVVLDPARWRASWRSVYAEVSHARPAAGPGGEPAAGPGGPPGDLAREAEPT